MLGLELGCDLVLNMGKDLLLDFWDTEKLSWKLDLWSNLSYCGHLWCNSNGGYL